MTPACEQKCVANFSLSSICIGRRTAAFRFSRQSLSSIFSYLLIFLLVRRYSNQQFPSSSSSASSASSSNCERLTAPTPKRSKAVATVHQTPSATKNQNPNYPSYLPTHFSLILPPKKRERARNPKQPKIAVVKIVERPSSPPPSEFRKVLEEKHKPLLHSSTA